MPETKADQETPELWLQRIGQHRDRTAFIRLFEHFAPRLKAFLMRGGLSDAQAEELVQDTMLTVWQKAQSYKAEQAAASTWIFTIARNRKIDLLRKFSRAEPNMNDPLLVPDDDENAPDRNLTARERHETLARAMDTLPEEQADLLYKAYYEDKTHQDIVKETGLPLGTVKSRIRLALDKLRNTGKVKALWT